MCVAPACRSGFMFVTRRRASANTRPGRPANNHLNGSHRGGRLRMGADGVTHNRIHICDYTARTPFAQGQRPGISLYYGENEGQMLYSGDRDTAGIC